MSRRPVRFQDTNAYELLSTGCLPMLIVVGLVIAAIVIVLLLVL